MTQHFIPNNSKTQDSILEFLWESYNEGHPVDDEWVNQQEERLQPVFDELSLETSDALTALLVDFCAAYQHAAFLEGIRIGFRLQEELQTKNPGS